MKKSVCVQLTVCSDPVCGGNMWMHLKSDINRCVLAVMHLNLCVFFMNKVNYLQQKGSIFVSVQLSLTSVVVLLWAISVLQNML